jgi:hypothetical protein
MNQTDPMIKAVSILVGYAVGRPRRVLVIEFPLSLIKKLRAV